MLALMRAEPGAARVAAALRGSTIGAANLAEVIGKVVDIGGDALQARRRLEAAGVVVEPVTAEDALLAGAMRALDGGKTLSLGDRLCLALTVRSSPAAVLTSDREWALLDLPISVRLIR